MSEPHRGKQKRQRARTLRQKRRAKEGRMRPVPTIRIFGYGSLLNPKTVAKRLPGQRIVRTATLGGWQRTFRKLGTDHVYLTLRRSEYYAVVGTLIDVTPPELTILTRSEPGYVLTDVTDQMVDYPVTEPGVYAFIAPVTEVIPERLRSIRKSYLDTCLEGAAPRDRERWLEETEFPVGVIVAEDA